MTSRRKCFT